MIIYLEIQNKMSRLYFYFLSLLFSLEFTNCVAKEEEADPKPLLDLPEIKDDEDSQGYTYSSLTPNVGSELFCETRGKQCWTPDDQLLLDSRRIFQDLIPIKVVSPLFYNPLGYEYTIGNGSWHYAVSWPKI